MDGTVTRMAGRPQSSLSWLKTPPPPGKRPGQEGPTGAELQGSLALRPTTRSWRRRQCLGSAPVPTPWAREEAQWGRPCCAGGLGSISMRMEGTPLSETPFGGHCWSAWTVLALRAGALAGRSPLPPAACLSACLSTPRSQRCAAHAWLSWLVPRTTVVLVLRGVAPCSAQGSGPETVSSSSGSEFRWSGLWGSCSTHSWGEGSLGSPPQPRSLESILGAQQKAAARRPLGHS